MLDLTEVKSYLRIPYDDDDTYLKVAIDQGYGYLRDAVDDYDDLYESVSAFADKCDLWVLSQWLPAAYDRREGMFTGVTEMDYAARAMLTQIQMYRKEVQEDGTET